MAHVQSMYTTLAAIKRESVQQRRRFILCGDFNAEVGSWAEYDNERIIGNYGLNSENSRGQWMKQWSTNNNLAITNTFFSKRPCNRETFIGPNGRPRQLDYILMDKLLFRMLHDSCSTSLLQLGSDHKAVRAKLLFEETPRTIRRKTIKKSPCITWSGVDAERYKQYLDSKLSDARMEMLLYDRCKQIENMMTEAAEEAASTPVSDETRPARTKLRELVEERHRLSNAQTYERKALSKSIKKEIKAIRSAESESKSIPFCLTSKA